VASASQACHCVVGVSSGPNGFTNGLTIGEPLYLSQDLTRWTPLPPLPVKGTSAEDTGVYQVLGLSGDGRLLVVGADPDAGVPESPAGVGGPPPRLWAWNTHTKRWEIAQVRVPCQDAQACTLYSVSASAVVGAAGTLQGTMFWLTGVVQAVGSQAPPQTFYRLFLPVN
jgi:hypothetical protein